MTSPSLRSVLTEIADKLTWRDDTERLRFHDRIAAATEPPAPPAPPAPVPMPPYAPTQPTPTPSDPYPGQ
jgi:hypothetical protein